MAQNLDLSNAIEFLSQRVFYIALSSPPFNFNGIHFFSIDEVLQYYNFYLDFGPLNLGQFYQFCQMLNQKLTDPLLKNKHIYFYSSPNGQRRANAVCLLASWGMIYLKMSPEEAFAKFENCTAFPPFHDATPTICTYKLTILDCLRGLKKAIDKNYFSIEEFNYNEFSHYEKVENGDLTWLSKKFIAFAGPHDNRSSVGGYYNLTPQDYIPYFKRNNVTLVIRLNEKRYNESLFKSAGIDHLELYYPDGGNPPPQLLQRFLDACAATPGVVAVHCKAGLGRTGTCIGCYMMMHDRFTAAEVIGWLRLCRPGSVIGPQQQFMEANEKKMWIAGGESSNLTLERKNSLKNTSNPLHIVKLASSTKPSKITNIAQPSTLTKVSQNTKTLRFDGSAIYRFLRKSQGDNLMEKKRYQQQIFATSG